MKALLERLLEREDLAEAEARDLLRALTSPELPPALAGALLAALRAKGVSAVELRGFAAVMREQALRPVLPPGPPAVDIVGTGGDRSGSLNLSTGAALLTAAAGQRVVKHGNRSVSSRAGAADVLEQLGLALPLDAVAAGHCLAATGFTFLFSPHYHPAMKSIAPVRQALGVRTVFNILGPLSNPAAPEYHVIGAYSSATAALMANALAGLPLTRAFVVHGADGWDEPTPVGPFELYEVRPGRVQRTTRAPEDYGLARCRSADLLGGDAASNAAALRAVLRGAAGGAHRDALLLGAALALEVCGQVDGPAAGMARAAAAIDDGSAGRLLDALAHFRRGGAA
jgi:anthranilate phosphoribosyltransferase